MLRLFRVFIPASVIGLVFSELLMIFACYLIGARMVTWFINPDFPFLIFIRDDAGLARIGFVAVCLIAGLYFQDLYANFRVKSLTVLVQQLSLDIGFVFLLQAGLAYAKRPEWALPRWDMIFGSALVLLVIPSWRGFYSRVVVRALRTQRVLFMGASPVVRELATHYTERPEIGMRIVGFIEGTGQPQDVPGGEIKGGIADLERVAEELEPDLVVVGLSERRQELPMAAMLRLRFSGVRFEEAEALFEETFGRVLTRHIRLSQLVFSADIGPRKNSLFWHSFYSTIIATILFIIALPIMAILALIVRLTSPGPVFHRQVRVGLNEKPFTLYKFRSMYVDAEKRTGAVWATKNDPRITAPGRWMRRLRLDELPQLINVLRGQMSLVGPRPERPEFVTKLAEQIPYYNYRHCVKPGLTGWAQINYKYGDTLEDAIMKFEFDLYYIKNLTVSLDMYIVFHTAKVMLFSGMAQ